MGEAEGQDDGLQPRPKGWAAFNGHLMHINLNQALFSLLGTTLVGTGG
jgi:microcystin-dependent protein